MSSLKIIIFDGSFKTTPFINRLIKELSRKNKVYLLGFNEQVSNKVKKVNYIPLGSNQNKISLITASLSFAFKARSVFFLFKILQLIARGNKKNLQQHNLNQAIMHINPDIVHLQWPSVIPWVEQLLIQEKVPVVLSQRGYHNNVRPFVQKENYNYLKKWYPKIAGFHSVSHAVSKKGDLIYGSKLKIDQVVYTGLPIENITFNENYEKNANLKILSIGRGHWIKGYEYAIQSCKILKEKGVSFQYTIIGGEGNEELQFLIDELGLSNDVFLTGRILQKEVFHAMHSSSVLLLSSIEEGLPNVIVEAMAVGLPVISSNCGGVGEVLENDKNGWVLPARDANAIAGAIINFINTPKDKIEIIRKEARKKVSSQHSMEKMVSGMVHLYKRVLKEN